MAHDRNADVVELEIWIAASPAVVYPFLTDQDRLVRWMGIAAKIEALPGGIFRIDVNGRDVVRGEFVDLIPDRRVVFSWGWEGSEHGIKPGSTTVSIELEPERGGTRLRLRHTGLRGDNREKHARGWEHHTARLKMVAEGGDPGPDPLATLDVRHG